MPSFKLIITADDKNHSAEFRLLDANDAHLAYQHTDFNNIAVSRQQGLFDLSNYLRNYVDAGREAASVGGDRRVHRRGGARRRNIPQALGICGRSAVCCIQLPGATEEENPLAAAPAPACRGRYARPSAEEPTLG